jgi:ethanolamine utilization protein EutQ (cupin superfamily)
MACRALLPAPPEGWDQLAVGEWELSGTGFGDCHPHDEMNYVLEGTLVVVCEGERMELSAGEIVRVPAGCPAWYEAPTYARMLYIYGPNPDGRPTRTLAGPHEACSP